MIAIRIWSGSGNRPPSSSLLETAHQQKMPKAKAYRMEDGSLLICLPYDQEVIRPFEKLLQNSFGQVPVGQAGLLKSPHYCKKVNVSGVR